MTATRTFHTDSGSPLYPPIVLIASLTFLNLPLSTEEKLDYLTTYLSHCMEAKPDFKAVAAEKGIANANNA
jgi:hypothetical protein